MIDCKYCKQIKPLSEFSKVAPHQHKRGYHSWCKPCMAAATQRYQKRNPEKKAKWKREYKVRSYGISVEQYQQMVDAQDNRCAICGGVTHKALNIDHCHATGKVRGLLCGNCNRALGMFMDSSEYLAKAIKYLSGGIK